MTRNREQPGHRFHEIPLVFFASLTVVGAGMLAGHFTAWALRMARWAPDHRLAGAATLILTVGTFLSLFHLGRPTRAALALRRTGRSPLSTEVALALLTIIPAAAALVLGESGSSGPVLWSLVAVASPGLLLTLGWVYRLPGQLSWKGAAALSPLALGLTAGLLSQAAVDAENSGLMTSALALLALDTIGFALRWKAMKWETGFPAYPRLFNARRRILLLRLIDVLMLPLLFMLAQAPLIALLALTLGIFMDRFAFYALALRETTESEISRVEMHLRSR